MTNYNLSFGTITLIQNDIAEVIVNEGVIFSIEMVAEYHEFILNTMQHPCSLLINKINSYTYTFETQQHLATLPQINAMAVVSYNKATETTTKSLASVARETPWELKIFKSRDHALKWLEVKQAIV